MGTNVTYAASKPDIIAQYGAAIDANSGEILYEKNADERANPASITKIMTAILLEENVKDGEMIKVSDFARNTECSCFGFEPGESISKENALNAMLMVSANDMAMAIAEHISGSKEAFGKLMTKRAHEIGAVNTTFTTPNGLTEPNHKTTAHDMALITREAMKYPPIVAAMGMKEANIKTSMREKTIEAHGLSLENPLVIGAKTGYTDAAGHTLVQIMRKDGKTVITVVMKSSKEGKYSDSDSIGLYALNQLKKKTILKKDDVVKTVKVQNTKVPLYISQTLTITYIKDHTPKIEKEYQIDKLETVKKNQVVGKLIIKEDGNQIKKLNLYSSKTVKKVEKVNHFKVLTTLLVILAGIAVGYFIHLLHYNKKRIDHLKSSKEQKI
jgi:D-alanyl-D-alanine carboxypeptidase